MGLLVTLLGGSGQENTVRSTHTKYRTATKEYVPTTPIFYTNKITTFNYLKFNTTDSCFTMQLQVMIYVGADSNSCFVNLSAAYRSMYRRHFLTIF